MNEDEMIGYEVVIFDWLKIARGNERYLSAAGLTFYDKAFLVIFVLNLKDLIVYSSYCLDILNTLKVWIQTVKVWLPWLQIWQVYTNTPVSERPICYAHAGKLW